MGDGMRRVVSESRPLDAAEQHELLQQITLLLTRSLPAGWTECAVVHRALGSHSETLGQMRRATGPGLPSPVELPDALDGLFRRLRAGMYRPGVGTWFTATLNLAHPNSYEVQYDNEGEPAWSQRPPEVVLEEERRMFPRDPQHTSGWLRRGAGELRVAKPFGSFTSDGTPVVKRPMVPESERDAVVRYLEQAPVVLAARGFDDDLLDPARPRRVPLTYRTDGTWVWSGAVGYYLRVHGVPPEPELVAHIRSGGFRVPEVSDEVRSAAVAAITGSA